jgi:Holliday junction resolvasome RuvABC endonuclease subunit
MDSKIAEQINVTSGYLAGGLAFNVVLFQTLVEKGVIDKEEFEVRVQRLLSLTKENTSDPIDAYAAKYVQLLLDVAKNG